MKKQKPPHRCDTSRFEFRRLHPHNSSDIIALNKLLHSSMQYYLLHNGAPPRPDVAQKLFLSIPKGKTESDKFVIAIFDGSEIIGCVDILRDFPQNRVAVIKLLLIAESRQNEGLGADLLAWTTALCATWNCHEIQLGVCTSNLRGFKFWRREGFKEIRREPLPGYTGEAIVMQHKLSIASNTLTVANQQDRAHQAV